MNTVGARFHLRNNWGQAVLAEGGVLCGQMALTLAEGGLLVGLGLPLGKAAFLYPSVDMRPVLARAVILVVLVALDLLILSPLKLGRSVFYWQMVGGWRPQPPGGWRRYFKGRLYGQAIGWRLRLWGLRLLWGLLCWIPALLLLWTGEWLRLDSLRRGVIDLTCAGFLFLGVLALAAGAIAAEMLMLRYRPAAYLIGQGMPVAVAFRLSPSVVKGHMEELMGLYARYSWRLLSCVLALPALYVMPLVRTEQARLIRQWAKIPAPIEKTTILW